jgi:hypothetical protein
MHKLVVVQRQTAAATGEDEHPGADQFIADVDGWAGTPRARGNPGGLGQNVITAVSDLAQLFDPIRPGSTQGPRAMAGPA